MKSDEQIADELQRASRKLRWISESDYPFDVVRWEQMSELTPDFLRRTAAQPADAPVRSESINDFFRPAMIVHEGQRAADGQAAEKSRGLLQALTANLQDVRVYRVGRINIAVYAVGRAPSGRWMGVATRVVET